MINQIIQTKQFQEAFRHKIIQVVAPASGAALEKMTALRAIKTLNFHIPDDLLSNEIPYHAHNDEYRFQQLKSALLDNAEEKIIWMLRGGYGCARLLDRLRELPVPRHQKIVIGFSDITALHLFLSQHWHWPTIHGSVLTQLVNTEQLPENFLRIAEIITKKVSYQTIEPLVPLNSIAEFNEGIQGQLTGGNLTLLEDSIGTHWQVQTQGKIMFVEEVGEKAYRIDRSLYHLFQAGIFKEVKAIILGDFLEPEGESQTHFALNRFAEDMSLQGIPVYKTDQFGHGKRNVPLIYHADSEIFFKKDKKTAVLRMTCQV